MMERILREAQKSYQRRILVATKNHEKHLADFISLVGKNIHYFGENEPKVSVKHFIHFKKTHQILGTTINHTIIDLRENMVPNDLGVIISAVRGGSLILLLTPEFSSWPKKITRYHEMLVTPPFTIDDVKPLFVYRVMQKLYEHEGIYFLEEKVYNAPKAKKHKKRKFKIPKKHPLFKMCASRDQVTVLDLLMDWNSKTFVLTANRGRGKSSIIGIFLAWYVSKWKKSVAVTSPEKSNVSSLFEFLKKGLKKLGIGFREENDVIMVEGGSVIEYLRPVPLTERRYYDLVVVDEAAGIPVPLLYKIVRKFPKIIFSTTIHGYEGAGRGFSLRFLKGLGEICEYTEAHMEEPIRYAENDPIEKFLFDTLLLDAEPEKPENLEKRKYVVLKKEELLNNERDLRNFVGIYIMAHYRNRPNDVAILFDAPHHEPRCVKCGDVITVALQIAREGGLSEEDINEMFGEWRPPGNIIPDISVKHFRIPDFARLVGYRIVRIATNPEFFGKGLGSFALQELIKEMEGKVDYLGTSFGATEELIRFWQRNGFIPIHLSLERNYVSGEYSTVLIKPLSERADELVKLMNYDFRIKLLHSIADIQFDIDPSIPVLLLKTPYKFKSHYKVILTTIQEKRFEGYYDRLLTYESCPDVIKDIARFYFTHTDRKFSLNEEEEKVIITKVFLGKSWRRTAEILETSETSAKITMRDAVCKIWEWLNEEALL